MGKPYIRKYHVLYIGTEFTGGIISMYIIEYKFKPSGHC